MNIEPQKVYQFAGTVYFRLVNIFALAQHSGAVHVVTVFRGDQIGSLKKDGSPVFPWKSGPCFTCRERRINRHSHMRFIAFMKMSQHVGNFMRRP